MTITCMHDFEQKQYRNDVGLDGADLSGLCMTLCAKWCHLILSDEKDHWSNPKAPASVRFRYFYSPEVYQEIAKEQKVSDARLRRYRTATAGVEQMIDIAKIMGQQGFIVERTPLINTLKETVPELDERGANIPRQILSRFGCRNIGLPTEIRWDTLARSFEEKKCYTTIFSTENGQHAVSGYVSGSMLNNDYHIFDPNYGEFKATGTESAQNLFNLMAKNYNNPKVTRLFLMQL